MSKNQEKQFEKIYDNYIDKIYRFVFLKVDSQEAAQDVTAQVFTKGWRKFKTGTRIKNVSAYLYQIARAEVANYYRGSRKYQVVSVESVQIVDTEQDIEQQQIKGSDIDEVKKLLGQLDEDSQNVLIWRYLDGYSNKEVADKLFVSVSTVKKHINHVYGKLNVKTRIQAVLRAKQMNIFKKG